MATIINAAHQFKNIFSTNGYFLIMPDLLRIYSNNQVFKLSNMIFNVMFEILSTFQYSIFSKPPNTSYYVELGFIWLHKMYL